MFRLLFRGVNVLSLLLLVATLALWCIAQYTGERQFSRYRVSRNVAVVTEQHTLVGWSRDALGFWFFERQQLVGQAYDDHGRLIGDITPSAVQSATETEASYNDPGPRGIHHVLHWAIGSRFTHVIELAQPVWELSIQDSRLYHRQCRIEVPFRHLALIFALIAGGSGLGMLINRWQRRRRTNNLRCLACGYDLRATPERCPECGTLPENSTPAR